MISETLEQLIARGESKTLEFKKSPGQLRRGVETIVDTNFGQKAIAFSVTFE